MKLSTRNGSEGGRGTATIVAANTRITGNIRGKGDYVVRGRVDGDCDIDGPVTVAQGGHWKGTLRASRILIAGTFEGDLVAQGVIEIARSARIAGSISGHSIAVAEGAVVDGQICMLDRDAKPVRKGQSG